MSDLSAKRRRLSLPLELAETTSGGEVIRSGTLAVQAYCEQFDRQRCLELANQKLSGDVEDLKRELEERRVEINELREDESTRQQVAEALLVRYWQEREASEEAYRIEITRTADAVNDATSTKDALSEALLAAEVARNNLVDIQGSYKQDQLLAQAKIKGLEAKLLETKNNTILEASAAKSPLPPSTSQAERTTLEQLAAADRRAEAERHIRRDLEIQVKQQQQLNEQAQIELRKARSESDGSNAEIIHSLRSELKSQSAQNAHARKLQEKIKSRSGKVVKSLARDRSIGVLSEKLGAATARAERAEEEVRKSPVAELQAQILALEGRLRLWEAKAEELGVETPDEVSDRLAQMRGELLSSTSALSEANLEVSKLKGTIQAQLPLILREISAPERLAATETQSAEAEAALHSAQGSNVEVAASAARYERKVRLLAKEKEGLEKMLASMSAERAGFRPPSGGEEATDPRQQRALIESLETQLAECKAQIAQLEATASGSATATKELQERVADSLARAAAAEADQNRSAAENQRLTAEVERLQERVDRGEFNSSTTRVLHYVLNPETLARAERQEATVQELQQEVALLKLQLEKAATTSGDREESRERAAPAPSPVLEAEIVVLRQKAAELAKREQRLRDVFQKKVLEFREAVFQLFGYRVDMAAEASAASERRSPPTTFVLRPRGHEDDTKMKLIFQFKGDRMRLVPNEFSTRELKREVETFIDREEDILPPGLIPFLH